MSGRLDEDLARWEAGELTLPELEDRYPDGYVRELVTLHDRLVDLTAEETPDPQPGWMAMRTRLPPRRIPNRWARVGRRVHRPAVVAAVAAVLAGGFAFAAEPVRQAVSRVLGDVIELIRPGDASTQLASSVKDVSAMGKEDTSIEWTPSVENVDDELTCSTITSPAHGIVTVVSDCSGGSYTPDPDFNGTDSFTYGVADPVAAAAAATVSITVEPVNDAPVADDDDDATREDTAVTIDVLGNDSDVDDDTLTVRSATGATNGSVTTTVDGSVTYTPDSDFHGTDSFTYAVADSTAERTRATVTITVDPVNDAPVADDDAAATREDTAVTIDVLGNDSDVDGDPLTVDSATGATNGSVTTADDGSLTYTPHSDFHGTDSFTYTVVDATGEHIAATVSVTVEAVNDAPVADDDDATTQEETAVTIDVLGNDSDVEGDSLTVNSATGATNGSVTTADDRSVTYTPHPDFHGTDSFTYTVVDATGEHIAATVSVTVEAVNDAPVADDDDATTQEETAVTIDVLGNDSDVEGDSLTVNSATGATNGSVTTADDRSVTYTPHPDFHGTDSFTYTVVDPAAEPTVGTVTITVEPVNDAPVADDAFIGAEEDTTTPWTPSVSDVDADVLTCSITTPPAHGSVTLNPDCTGGSYTPESNFGGTDTIVYEVFDRLAADAATVTVEVRPANDAPGANDVAAGGPEDTTIPWTPSVSDVDADVLTCSITTPPAHGGSTVNPDCSGGSYTPDPNYNGPDSNAYGVSDGGATDTATVTVQVSPVNDPVAPPP